MKKSKRINRSRNRRSKRGRRTKKRSMRHYRKSTRRHSVRRKRKSKQRGGVLGKGGMKIIKAPLTVAKGVGKMGAKAWKTAVGGDSWPPKSSELAVLLNLPENSTWEEIIDQCATNKELWIHKPRHDDIFEGKYSYFENVMDGRKSAVVVGLDEAAPIFYSEHKIKGVGIYIIGVGMGDEGADAHAMDKIEE